MYPRRAASLYARTPEQVEQHIIKRIANAEIPNGNLRATKEFNNGLHIEPTIKFRSSPKIKQFNPTMAPYCLLKIIGTAVAKLFEIY